MTSLVLIAAGTHLSPVELLNNRNGAAGALPVAVDQIAPIVFEDSKSLRGSGAVPSRAHKQSRTRSGNSADFGTPELS